MKSSAGLYLRFAIRRRRSVTRGRVARRSLRLRRVGRGTSLATLERCRLIHRIHFLRIHLRHRNQPVAFVDADELHPSRVAAGFADFLDARTDQDALLRDEHQLVRVAHGRHADHVAVTVVRLDVDHALAAALDEAVRVDGRALAEAVDAGGQHHADVAGVALRDDDHADDFVHAGRLFVRLIVLGQLDAAHATRGTAHGADVRLLEADSHALLRAEQDLVVPVGDFDRDERIAVFQADGDDAVRADVRVGAEGRLLHDAALGGEHQEALVLAEILYREHVRDLLILLELQQVGDGPTLARAAALGHVVHAAFVHAALVREEHQVVVRVRDEQVLDEVAFARFGALDPAPATALRAVGVGGQTLDVAVVADGDDDVFLRDQRVHVERADAARNLRAAIVAVLLLHLQRVLADDVHHEVVVAQDRLVALDLLGHFAVLVHELLDLEPDELDELQASDRLGLHLREQDGLRGDAVHQPLGDLRRKWMIHRDAERAEAQLFDRLLARLARANQTDDLIDVADGEDETFQDVRPLLRLFQQELRPPSDDDFAVRDEVLDQLLQPHRARLAVDQRDVDHAHRDLARRVLVKLVDHELRVCVALEVDDDADLVLAARLVVDRADVVDQPLLHGLGDAFDDVLANDPVRDLVDDDALPPIAALFDAHLRAEHDASAAGAVALDDAVLAADRAARREVRAGDDLEQLVEVRFRLVDHADDRVADFAQVVRQQVARHAHRDARRAVHEQVGELAGQDGRLHEPVVVLRLEVDRVVLQVREQFALDQTGPGFGVTHGRGRVAVGAAKVALSVDERVAERPILRQAHEGRVHDRFAVRVIVARRVAGDRKSTRLNSR